MVTGLITAIGGQVNPQGQCSRCGRIWTLKTEQGVCQWCGKLATCQTRRTQALRSFKSRSNHRRKQTQVNGNGYEHLEGEWAQWYHIAQRFENKVPAQDREDLRHNIIVRLADVSKRKALTLPACYRVASYCVADYWRNHFKLTNGLDCHYCSTRQRHLCRQHWLYEDCPKARKLESLNRQITDDNGNVLEFGDLIADDKALDLDAWLDAKTFLRGCPKRLYEIARNIDKGIQLDATARKYLSRFRKREQINLF